ncbi:2,3-diphosphoglycerate-dependent phosphoglycerate mutase [soil metagenome]
MIPLWLIDYMQKLVLIRHGESTWNKENRFTGWTDVDLSEEGVQQAKRAGQLLKQHGYNFDAGFTSVLKRSIKTLHFVLEELDHLWIPVQKSWRLNERFYGALQGLNKAETVALYGETQVQKWRRDPHELPPAITKDDDRYPGKDIRYKDLTERELPLTENLSQTMDRVLPFWNESIVPAMRRNQKVIVCAHGNSLRALI